jgi:hypothetical protein
MLHCRFPKDQENIRGMSPFLPASAEHDLFAQPVPE